MAIETVLGDYIEFFTGLQQQLAVVGIETQSFALSHLCYRVASLAEYAPVRDALKAYCAEFTEDEFNGRPISMLWLREPLMVTPGRAVQLIELPALKPSHAYPTGLEHCGFVAGAALPGLIARHGDVLHGVKDRGAHCQPAFITFADGKTAKFYERMLREVVELEGRRFTAVK